MKNVPVNMIPHYTIKIDSYLVNPVRRDTFHPVKEYIFDKIGKQVHENIFCEIKEIP